MGFIASMLVKLGLDNSDFNTGMDKSTRTVNKFGEDVQSAGTRLTVGLSIPLIGVGVAALQAAGKMEQNQVAFTTLLKSADAAKVHLEDLKKFALVTPFQFDDLTRMSRLMQAFGTQAGDVVPRLRTLGNAVSALGGGNDVLERVVRSMGEIGTRGRITGEQLRELSRAGIPALEAIAAKLGITVAETQAKVTAGMVDAQVATDALMSYMDKRFSGGMEAQSRTLLGMWSNIKDKLGFTLVAIGDALLPWAKSFVNDTLDPMLGKIKDVAEAFKNLPKPLQDVALGAGAAAVTLPLLTVAIGATITNAIVIATTFGRLLPLLGSLSLMISGTLIGTLSAAATWFGTLGLAAGAAASLGLAALAVGIWKLVDAWSGYRAAVADNEAMQNKAAAALSRLEAKLREQGIQIDYVRKQYDAGNITFYTYLLLLKDLATQHRDATGATAALMTAQQALDGMNLRSTAQRQKDLEVAKEQYAALVKGGEGHQVLAEAELKVKQATEALNGTQEKMKENLRAIPFREKSLEAALIVDEYDRLIARQKTLVKEIGDWRNGGMFSAMWHMSPAAPPDLSRLKGSAPVFGEGEAAGTLEWAHNLDAAAAGMKKIGVETIKLPPELRKIQDALDVFGQGGEKNNVSDLTEKIGLLGKALKAGEITQRTYDLAWIKYIEDLDAAGVVLDKATKKEYELAKARTHQLADAKKEQTALQREVSNTFRQIERGLATSIVHWKGFGAAVKGIFQSLAETVLTSIFHVMLKSVEKLFGQVLTSIAEKLAGTAIAEKVAASLSDVAQVGGAAAVGGAQAAASIAAIPIIGPALALEAGAAMYASILATFGPLALFERGGNVPADMPAYLHMNEMVLPADIAIPLRRMVASGPAAGSGGGGFHGCSFYGVTKETVNALASQMVRQARLSGARI